MEQSAIDPEFPSVAENEAIRIINNEELIIENNSSLTPQEYHQVVYEWNMTDKSYPQDKTIQALFQEQAARTPDNTAIIYQGGSLSYNELNEKSNQLARHIRGQYRQRTQRDFTADTLVALFLERSPETVIGILAVLKAGGAYVPIDTSYPQERINYMLEDSGAQIILSQRRLVAAGNIYIPANKIVYADLEEYLYQLEESSNLLPHSKATDLAYVIYTSGTTGKPKGVMVEHKNIASKSNFYKHIYHANEAMVSLFYRSYSFDGALEEYLVPILHGGKMVIYPPGIFDLRLFADTIKKSGVTKVNMPPQLLYKIIELDAALFQMIDILVSGGDKLDFNKLRGYNFGCEIFNAYGPTECTNDSHIYRIDLDNLHPDTTRSCIGKSVFDCKSYILDQDRKPVQVGVAGELYVSGSGLARGYLNRPDLTEERFVQNPFASVTDIEMGYTRMYRTGDEVRWLPGGNIEYIGRIDDQVKIRGYRIEPGEIEYVISGIEGIKQSCVVVKERKTGADTEKYLVGYYVSDGTGITPSTESILEKLKLVLPEYMVPAALIAMESFPLNVNGKLDRRALPEPDFSTLPDKYVAPVSAVEANLCAIWQDVLGLGNVGVTDDFFRIGGNSILAIQASHRMSKSLAYDVKVADIFKHRTIAQILHHVKERARLTIPKIAGNTGALSYAQERLWFIEQYEQGTNAYHMPDVYELDDSTDIDGLKYALQQVVARHEILRSTIKQSPDGHGIQQVHDEPLWIEEIRLAGDQDYEQLIKAEINRPFDLSNEYPIRAKFYMVRQEGDMPGLRKDKIFLLVNVHHMASDGWSENIFQKELASYYEAYINKDIGFALPQLEIQYKDYAAWQRNYLTGETLAKQLDYWKGKLSGYQALELSTDYPRPQNISYTGAHYNFTISKEISNKARTLARHHGVTLNTVLLSTMNILLGKYTGQDDIIIGSPIANRHHRQTEEMIGFFVNMQVIRTPLNAAQRFEQLVQQIHQQQIEAQTYQDFPFIKLVDELGVERDPSRHPVFQVVFVVQNFGNQNKASNQLKKYINPHHAADVYEVEKFDLSVFIDDSKEELGGLISYATSLFRKDTIVRLIEHYIFLLEKLINTPDKLYSQADLLPPAEYNRIINEWNATEKPYPKEKTIYRLFEEQVAKTPGNIAVAGEGLTLSYQQLNEKSNQLARHIRAQYKLRAKREMEPGAIIVLCLDRGVELVIGIMAILKAGGAYAPMDPCYPKERLDFQIEDTRAEIVLTQRYLDLPGNSKLPASKVIHIDLAEEFYTREDKSNLYSYSGPNDIAYVIYTSGTTGKPKASLIEHHSFVNLNMWYANEFALTASCSYIICSEICFDLTQKNYFAPLVTGAKIFIPRRGPFDPRNICNIIIANKINRINCSPSAFSLILDELYFQIDDYSFDYIFLGGEPIPDSILQITKSKMRGGYFVNTYGPSECSDVTTFYKIPYAELPDTTIPLGIPVDNFKHYVLDGNGQPVPIGVKGELYISGIGLSREYLNNRDLTNERFIPNPFTTVDEREQGYDRLYKTGDVVRWLADGNLEYLGRNDDQVKIKGFRIELGEIENALTQIEGINQACVLVKNKQSEKGLYKHLVAYYTLDANYNKANYSDILSGWEHLYDAQYEKTIEELTLDADFTGWNSYITEAPIPLNEMEQWRSNILAIIRSLNPRNVLEIGVGSGLLMYPLLTHVKKYTGLDLSLAIVNRHKAQVNGKQYNAEFYHLKADQIDQLPEGEFFDTIIINSVCQYFPDIKYFDDVIEQSIGKLSETGAIFLGDVRNYDLHKELIKEKLAYAGMPHNQQDIDRAALKVNELLISPGYFSKFKKAYKDINVEVVKRDTGFNKELGKYRFDVVISKNRKSAINNGAEPYSDADPGSSNKSNSYHNIPYLNQLSKENIIKSISGFLPAYMVPGTFVAMESFPLTVNGKLDKRALPDPDINLSETEHVAPVNEIEKELCKIWEQVFGVEKISTTDNFFRIGGDSILSIQVSGRIRQAGYPCQVKDIFEYKTISKLAAHLIKKSREMVIEAEQGKLTGELGFLPIQEWFILQAGREFAKPGHWNQSFLIKVPELDPMRLENMIGELVAHHDVFSIRYIKEQQCWRQFYHAEINVPALKTLDISKHTATETREILTAWQSRFDLERGPLFQAGYLYGYADGSARIFMAMHHMIVDSVSWRILAEDLKNLYSGIPLPRKSSSYRQWVASVKKYTAKHPAESAYWEEQLKGMPVYRPEQQEPTEDIFELTEGLTASLLQEASKAYHTEVNDLLLTALAYALKDINQADTQGITLEGHGREEIDPSIDHSRTIGWFTTMFPVKLELKDTIKESIQFIKESLRRIPNKGIGFGAFATDAGTPYTQNNLPHISFNYLGQFDGPAGDWQIAPEDSGKNIHAANADHNVIFIEGMVSGGKLRCTVETRLGATVTRRLSNSFKTQLASIIAHCIETLENKGSNHTPSDFKAVKISQALLNKLQSKG